LFSILFGAGIVIMTFRSPRPAIIHYRRMLWLLVFGLAHAYLLWYGDILNTYAILGAILYPARRLRPALLIALGLAVLSVAIFLRARELLASLAPPAQQVSAALSHSDRIMQRAVETESAAYRGSWLDLLRWRARINTAWHLYGGIDFNFWRCGGFILIGMGLVQLGILSASRPTSIYAGLAIGGYSLGLTLAILGFWPQLARALGRAPQVAADARPMLGLLAWSARYIGAIAMTCGHIGLIMLACKLTTGPALAPLAAAGRMALSNYILQTLIAVSIFDGWAGGQWGRWRFAELTLLVAAVWAAQLVLSPLYFRFFRIGPLEWLWRTLTYLRPQPFLAHSPAPAA
jgi:uncharacterized protein